MTARPTTPAIQTTLAPWLSVRGSAGAVEFYKTAFGAVEVYRMEDPTGSLVARLSPLGAGAKQVYPVGEEYGWRVGRVVDLYGHHWEIGHPLA
jgi:PhnB protein